MELLNQSTQPETLRPSASDDQGKDVVGQVFQAYQQAGLFGASDTEDAFRQAAQDPERRKKLFEAGQQGGVFGSADPYSAFSGLFEDPVTSEGVAEQADRTVQEVLGQSQPGQEVPTPGETGLEDDLMSNRARRYEQSDDPASYLSALSDLDTETFKQLSPEVQKEEEKAIEAFVATATPEKLQQIDLDQIPVTSKPGRKLAIKKIDTELQSIFDGYTTAEPGSKDYAIGKWQLMQGGWSAVPEDVSDEARELLHRRRVYTNQNFGVIGSLANGLSAGARAVPMMGGNAFLAFANQLSDEESGPMRQAVERIVDRYAEESGIAAENTTTTLEQVFQSEESLKAFTEWASYNMGQGLGTAIPLVAASMVSAPLMLASAYTMGVGDIYGEMRDRGIEEKEWLAITGGVPYAAAERLLGLGGQALRWTGRGGAPAKSALLKGASSAPVKQGTTQAVVAGAKGLGASVLKEGASEGLEEGLFVKQLVDVVDPKVDAFSKSNLKATLKHAGEAAAAGMLPGVAFGGISVPASVKRDAMARKWQASKDAQFKIFSDVTGQVNQSLAPEVNINYDSSKDVDEQYADLNSERNRLNAELSDYLSGDAVNETVVSDYKQAIELTRTMMGGLKDMVGFVDAVESGDVVRFQKGDERPISEGHNPEIFEIARSYVEGTMPGAVPPNPGYQKVDVAEQLTAADDFSSKPHAPNDPLVKASYDALKQETLAQWNKIMENGFDIEPYLGEGDSYGNSKEMLEDMLERRHLSFFMTLDPTGGNAGGFGEGTVQEGYQHPLLEDSGIKIGDIPLTYNDLFRVVHDFFGHGVESYQFGARGEFNAWVEHSRMFTPLARAAMTAETRSQNAWQNYGPHMRSGSGEVLKPGDEGFMPLAERPFSEQKAFIPDPAISGVELTMVDGQVVATERGDSIINREVYEADQALSNRFGPEQSKAIEDQVKAFREQYPRSQGFAQVPLQVARYGKGHKLAGQVKRDKNGNAIVEVKPLPYTFQQGFRYQTVKIPDPSDPSKTIKRKQLTPESKELAEKYAAKEVAAYRDLERRAAQGDIEAIDALENANWYMNTRESLNLTFREMANLMSNLLAATSPMTPVKSNWDQAVEALTLYNEGAYDQLIQDYIKFIDEGGTTDQWSKETKRLPKKSNGTNYGANGALVLEALAAQFQQKYERGGGAPKALTFDRNLSGRGEEPTIDIWMGRRYERLISGRVIPTIAEKGTVSGNFTGAHHAVDGQYGVATEILTSAAKQVGLEPQQLQAVFWIEEKNLWDRHQWTPQKKSSVTDYEAAAESGGGVSAFYPGITSQQGMVKVGEDGTIDVNGEKLTLEEVLDRGDIMVPAEEAIRIAQEISSLIPKEYLITASNGSALGGYQNAFERSVGQTILVKKGYVPYPAAVRAMEIGKEANQESVMFTQVLGRGESSPNERPGLVINFAKPLPVSAAMDLANASSKNGFDGFTIMLDPTTGGISGINYILAPEFGVYYGALSPDAVLLKEWVQEQTRKMKDLQKAVIEAVGGQDRVQYIGDHQVDPLISFRENYDETIASINPLAGGVDRDQGGDSSGDGAGESGGVWGRSLLSSSQEARRAAESRPPAEPDGNDADGPADGGDGIRAFQGNSVPGEHAFDARTRRIRRYTDLSRKFADEFGGNVVVAASMQQLPPEIRDHKYILDERVRAIYYKDTDTIYIFPARIQSEEQLARILAHEALHQGIRSAFGSNLDGILTEVLQSVQALPEGHPQRLLLNEIARKYNLDPNGTDLELAEEFVARASETSWYAEDAGPIRKIINFIREALLRLFDGDQYRSIVTDRLVREAVHQSRTALRNPILSQVTSLDAKVVRFSLDGEDSTLIGMAEASIKSGETLGSFLTHLETQDLDINYDDAIAAWKEAQATSLESVQELSKIAKKDRPEDFGRKDLANPFKDEDLRDYFDAVNEGRKGNGIHEVQSDKEVYETAIRRLNRDYQGEKARIFRQSKSGTTDGWGAVEQRMANIILGREGWAAMATGDREIMMDFQMMVDMNIRKGTEWGRAGRQRRDQVMSPQQRLATDVADVVREATNAAEVHQAVTAAITDLNEITKQAVGEALTAPTVVTAINDLAAQVEPEDGDAINRLKVLETIKKRIAAVVDAHYTAKNKAHYKLQDALVEGLGLEGEDAADFVTQFENEMGRLTNQAKAEYLEKFFKARKKLGKRAKGLPQDIQRIIKSTNAGALEIGDFRESFGKMFGLPNINDVQAARIRDFADRLQIEKGPKRNKTLSDMIRYLDAQRVTGGNLGPYHEMTVKELMEQISDVEENPADVFEESKDTRVGLLLSAMLTPSKRELKKAGDDQVARRKVYEKAQERFKQVAEALKLKKIDLHNLTDEDLVNDKVIYEIIRSFQAANAATSDKIYEYYLNALLSAPTTQAVNLIGNTVHVAWDYTAQRWMEAAVNALMPGQDLDTSTFGELKHLYKGMASALPKAFLNARRAFDVEHSVYAEELGQTREGTKWQEISDRGVAIDGKKGRYIRLPLRTILFIDEIFKTVTWNGEMSALAYREGKNKGLSGQELDQYIAKQIHRPSPGLRDKAWQAALDATFQNEPGAPTKAYLSLREAVPGLRYFTPFVSTPANLLRIGIRKSPLGIFNMLQKGVRSGANSLLMREGEFRYERPDLVKDAAEQVIGWAIFGLVAQMLGMGDDEEGLPLITGSSERYGSPQQRYLSEFAPPYSVRIGGKYYSYMRVEPLSTLLAPTVDFITEVNKIKGGKEVGAAFASMMGKMSRMITDKAYLQAVGDLYKAVEDPTALPALMQNFATAWMPNVVKHVVGASDPYVRDFRSRADGMDEAVTEFGVRVGQKMTRLPGLAPPPKVDWLGRETKRGSYGDAQVDYLYRLTTPVLMVDKQPHPADLLVMRYNRAHQNDQWYPSQPAAKTTFEGAPYEMDDEEYHAFLTRRGQHLEQMARDIAEDYQRSGGPMIAYIKALQRAQGAANEVAKWELYSEGVFNVEEIEQNRVEELEPWQAEATPE